MCVCPLSMRGDREYLGKEERSKKRLSFLSNRDRRGLFPHVV